MASTVGSVFGQRDYSATRQRRPLAVLGLLRRPKVPSKPGIANVRNSFATCESRTQEPFLGPRSTSSPVRWNSINWLRRSYPRASLGGRNRAAN